MIEKTKFNTVEEILLIEFDSQFQDEDHNGDHVCLESKSFKEPDIPEKFENTYFTNLIYFWSMESFF